MRSSSRLALHVAALALIAPLSAAGTAIRVSFSGTIDTVYDDTGISDGSVAPGTPFSGSVTFDDSVDPLFTDAYGSIYGFSTPPWAMSAQIGSYTVFSVANPVEPSAESLIIRIQHFSHPPDYVSFDSATGAAAGLGPFPGPLEPVSIGLLLQDTYGETFPLFYSSALDAVPYDLALWNTRVFSFSIGERGPTYFGAMGTVDSLEAVVVPEPGTGVLLALGTALLVLHRRRS